MGCERNGGWRCKAVRHIFGRNDIRRFTVATGRKSSQTPALLIGRRGGGDRAVQRSLQFLPPRTQ